MPRLFAYSNHDFNKKFTSYFLNVDVFILRLLKNQIMFKKKCFTCFLSKNLSKMLFFVSAENTKRNKMEI